MSQQESRMPPSSDASTSGSWVRSQFFVKGICCASEVPTVKGIIKPMHGVSRLNINITTKVVHVEHQQSLVSAQDIAAKLSRRGFPTKIQKDGTSNASAIQSNRQHITICRTSLRSGGVLTESDVPKIQELLGQLPGISRIGVNVAGGMIYIDHVSSDSQAQLFISKLVPSFVVSIVASNEELAADPVASILDQVDRSPFVESTISVDRFQKEDVITFQNNMARMFVGNEVRAFYPHVASGTIKVEHDPDVVSIFDMCETLSTFNVNAKVSVDGAELGLYLPLLEDDDHIPSVSTADDSSWASLHINVWLSGMFWALSIVSYFGDLEWFKYFGLLSVFFGLPPICVKAWRALRRSHWDANCMMVTAALGALALQEYDEAASVAFLFAISEFLETRATIKARKALEEICNLRPDHANVIHPISGEIVVLPADRVPLGSLVAVKCGDIIASDGVVVEGNTAIDESSLTGEAKPIHKAEGDQVSGGTINVGTTQLVVRTTTTVDNSAVSRLIRLVEEAQSNRSPTESLIDTFARSYTPTVICVAGLMCTLPWLWGRETGRYWTLNGLIIIVIACPCALTISTPVTYAAALAATAQRGVIVKGGAKLEAMGSVNRVIFDKTGTLTKGDFCVQHLIVVGTSRSRREMLELLSAMEDRSSHPLSTALVEATKNEGVQIPKNFSISDHMILPGEGITAKVNGYRVHVGNLKLCHRLGIFGDLSSEHQAAIMHWSTAGGTVGCIATETEGIIGMFCVKDMIRHEAKEVVQGLSEAWIQSFICTGDSSHAALAVAREIGIPDDAVHSQLLPEDKLHLVGTLKQPQPKSYALFRKKQYVLFCGDGVNDGPALAVADIGCSMGEGAAMAMEMSDITLMDSHLSKLLYTIKMGRRTLRTVKENIFTSLLAKAIVVGLTFAGKMSLLVAIAADVGITLLVTLNGMKLLPNARLESSAYE